MKRALLLVSWHMWVAQLNKWSWKLGADEGLGHACCLPFFLKAAERDKGNVSLFLVQKTLYNQCFQWLSGAAAISITGTLGPMKFLFFSQSSVGTLPSCGTQHVNTTHYPLCVATVLDVLENKHFVKQM